MSSDRKRNDAKQYYNMIHPPILTHSGKETTILELIRPPELHLLIGVVNTIYRAMIAAWSEGCKWLDLCYCHRERMLSGTFTGIPVKYCWTRWTSWRAFVRCISCLSLPLSGHSKEWLRPIISMLRSKKTLKCSNWNMSTSWCIHHSKTSYSLLPWAKI